MNAKLIAACVSAILGSAIFTPAFATGTGKSTVNWSGIYFGAHGGYAWSSIDWTNVGPGQGYNAIGTSFEASPNDWMAGGQVGIQKQWGDWLAGLEFSYSNGRLDDLHKLSPYGNAGLPPGYDGLLNRYSASVRDVVLATVRGGYAWQDYLFFAKAGLAVVNNEVSMSGPRTGNIYAADDVTADGWRYGFTLGTGVEYRISKAMSVVVDYTFISLADGTQDGLRLHSAFPPSPLNRERHSVDGDMSAVTLRLNVHLGSF